MVIHLKHKKAKNHLNTLQSCAVQWRGRVHQEGANGELSFEIQLQEFKVGQS
jgi:hypothetical protein